MLPYFFVLVGTFRIDAVPVLAPPAWMVMVLLQVNFGLNIWGVLVLGVLGSMLGRYTMSLYIRSIANRFISKEKTEDLEFLGKMLSQKRWRSLLFVLLYTLIPLPTTPLFQVAGIARIPALNILPAFFVGKFISDLVMVLAGKFAAENSAKIMDGLVSWQTVLGTLFGIGLMAFVLFTDWRVLLQQKRLKLNFKVWK